MAKKPQVTEKESYDGRPFVVIAKKAMHRGGRHWTPGVHEFTTVEQHAALHAQLGGQGDAHEAIGKMLDTLAVYPADFEVKMPGASEAQSQPQG